MSYLSRSLLRLGGERLRVLADLFGTSRSAPAHGDEFVHEMAQRLGLDRPTAESIALVCQFLLTVVESGHAPGDILRDVRDFVTENAPEGDTDTLVFLDRNSQVLEDLLTPKPARSRALKVRFLSHGLHPVAESFRSVCELRPVFECPNDKEAIVGFVPVVLLSVSISDSSGDLQPLLFQMTPDNLAELETVIKRTRERFDAVRARFGDELIES